MLATLRECKGILLFILLEELILSRINDSCQILRCFHSSIYASTHLKDISGFLFNTPGFYYRSLQINIKFRTISICFCGILIAALWRFWCNAWGSVPLIPSITTHFGDDCHSILRYFRVVHAILELNKDSGTNLEHNKCCFAIYRISMAVKLLVCWP